MWKYTGNGEHYPGIPARDLTDEEGAAYKVRGLPLYEYVKESQEPRRTPGQESGNEKRGAKK